MTLSDMYKMGRAVFDEVRDIPYRVSTYPGDPAPNCSMKAKLLLERLGVLGFTVRARMAEMDWADTLIPPEIVALSSKEDLLTHLYIEVMRDGQWVALDASWDRGLEKAGFPIANFDGTHSPAFPLKKVFDVEEQGKYTHAWLAPPDYIEEHYGEEHVFERVAEDDYVENYYRRNGPFLKAVNEWLAQVRRG
ncbi:MAG: hypothetical protein OXT65_07845 [Alphaproteobacteria bacterium]|nr:hypothetical protein [Alphaproteobacteria bacterium]